MRTASSIKRSSAIRRTFGPVRWAGLAAILCVGLVGCDATAPSNSEDPDGFNGGPLPEGMGGFGDEYDIHTQHPLLNAPIPPRVENDSLLVTVGYSGGCMTHKFELRADASHPTKGVLWLVHDSNNDACEAYLVGSLRKALPAAVKGRTQLTLLNPNGAPFTLAVSATE